MHRFLVVRGRIRPWNFVGRYFKSIFHFWKIKTHFFYYILTPASPLKEQCNFPPIMVSALLCAALLHLQVFAKNRLGSNGLLALQLKLAWRKKSGNDTSSISCARNVAKPWRMLPIIRSGSMFFVPWFNRTNFTLRMLELARFYCTNKPEAQILKALLQWAQCPWNHWAISCNM